MLKPFVPSWRDCKMLTGQISSAQPPPTLVRITCPWRPEDDRRLNDRTTGPNEQPMLMQVVFWMSVLFVGLLHRQNRRYCEVVRVARSTTAPSRREKRETTGTKTGS